MDLTFRAALPVFAVGLTMVYVALLLASKKLRRDDRASISLWSGRLAVAVTFILGISTVALLFTAQQVRGTATYSILACLTTASLLFALWLYRTSKTLPASILLCALINYVMVVWIPLPVAGFVMGERTAKLVALSEAGHWGPNWGLTDPIYDPFPMNIGIPLMASLATSLQHYAYELYLLLYLPFVFAYAIVIYALTKSVTHSWVAGILAVVLLGGTAPISILSHEAQWIGNLLVLVATLALIKLAEIKTTGFSHIVVINVCYGAAIFMHTSAAIALFIPMSIFCVDYLLKRSSRDNGDKVPSRKMNFHVTLFVTFFVITFGRMIYTAGYLEYFLPYLINFVTEMYGFVEPSARPSGEGFTPLYDRAHVSPVYAYAWATSLAMGTALIIYLLARRRLLRKNPVIPGLYTAAATFVLIGYIAGAAFKSPISPSFWRGMYVALPLILPAAAAAGTTILRSRRVLASILIVLLAVGVGIAVDDPMISPYKYAEIRGGSEALQADLVDVLEARQLQTVLPTVPGNPWVSTLRFAATFGSVRLAAGNLEPFPMTLLTKGEAISVFVEKNMSAEAYILPQEILSEPTNWTADLVYSGPRNVVLRDR